MHALEIKPSEKKDNKYKAVINGTKNAHFGAAGMSDYTKHKNDERKNAYIQRHKKNEHWTAAGFKIRWFSFKTFALESPQNICKRERCQ